MTDDELIDKLKMIVEQAGPGASCQVPTPKGSGLVSRLCRLTRFGFIDANIRPPDTLHVRPSRKPLWIAGAPHVGECLRGSGFRHRRGFSSRAFPCQPGILIAKPRFNSNDCIRCSHVTQWVGTAFLPPLKGVGFLPIYRDFAMTEDELRAEVERLKAAIRQHRDERGDQRCWLDDERLYAALHDDGTGPGDTALPPREEFLRSCERYWNQRQHPMERGRASLPGRMTIAQIKAKVERLRSLEPTEDGR